jgi:hypothetical protein
MDSFIQLENAEKCWLITCGNPILKHVDQEIVRRRAMEIRMLCMDETVLTTVAVRCWNCIVAATRMSDAQRTAEQHLTHYGPIQDAIADKISIAVIKGLISSLEKQKKNNLWRRPLKAMEILGCGISKLDERIFLAWWESVMENKDHPFLESEEDGAFTWMGIPIKEKLLMDWVAEKITAMDPRQAPEALRKFRVYLDPPLEMAQRVGRILFENTESPKEFVKLWVKLISNNVMESPRLLAQLMATDHDEKELKTELRRR